MASLAKMKDMNRQAIDDYAAEDYESAQLGLREAIALGQRAGLSREPFMARLFVNLGAVYISGLKDTKRGTRALQAALEIDPDIKPTDTMVTPELRELFSRLQPAAPRAGSTGSANVASTPPPAPPPTSKPAEPPTATPPATPPAAGPPDTAAPSPRPDRVVPAGATAPDVVAPPPASSHPAPAPAAPKKPEGAPATKVALSTGALPRNDEPEEPDLPARVPQPR
jgi:hypothetical protein